MKSIKQIAELSGMSKTSVNRAIKELDIETTMAGNKNVVSDKDADRIVSLLRGFGLNCAEINPNQAKSDQNQTETETLPPNSSSSVSAENQNGNEKLINFLMEQIKVKDNQISELQEENRMLIQAQAYTVKQLERFTNPELITTKQEENSKPDSKEESEKRETEPPEAKEEPKEDTLEREPLK